jgi:hypothetical protein
MVRAPFLGVILNGVNLDNPVYSYYRTYSHYYQHSHENEELHEPSAKDSDEGVTPSDNTASNNNGLGADSRKKHPVNQANGEGARQNPQNYCAKPVETGSLTETNEDTSFNSSRTPTTTAAETRASRRSKAEQAVSQAFLDRLTHVFTEYVGPLAPLIVRDQISALGESQNAFPRSRIDELLRSIESEILHPEIKLRFRENIAVEIRNLDNQ